MTRQKPAVNANLNNDQIIQDRHRPYHHGALRDALIAAGEAILRERGVDTFSLREAARRAGVSPGAPAHHFGDARGLLTAIAARAFGRLTEALQGAEAEAGPDIADRLRAQGHAYVQFALGDPAAFDLMWRCALLDTADADYRAASRAAYAVLRDAIEGDGVADATPPPSGPSPAVTAGWSIVHGFARLALDGAFDPWTPGLLDGVLRCLVIPEAATTLNDINPEPTEPRQDGGTKGC